MFSLDRYTCALALTVSSGIFACSAQSETDADEVAVGQYGSALSGPTDFFSSYSYHTTGPGSTERFLDCQADQVLSGVGARIIHDNVTDWTIYCRNIMPDGSLEPAESSYTQGGPSEEKVIHANNGRAIISFGSIVTSDNVFRLVLRQCPWVAAQRRIDDGNCNYVSTTPGSTSTELSLSVHSGLSASERPRTVATGVGMTATGDNTYAIRMSSGLLR